VSKVIDRMQAKTSIASNWFSGERIDLLFDFLLLLIRILFFFVWRFIIRMITLAHQSESTLWDGHV